MQISFIVLYFTSLFLFSTSFFIMYAQDLHFFRMQSLSRTKSEWTSYTWKQLLIFNPRGVMEWLREISKPASEARSLYARHNTSLKQRKTIYFNGTEGNLLYFQTVIFYVV